MPKKIVIPAFRSEAEDAAWHQTHKRELEREMARRLKEGTTVAATEAAARTRAKRSLRPITIRLPIEDIKFHVFDQLIAGQAWPPAFQS